MSIKIKNELKEVIIYGGLTMVKQRLTVGTKECISQYIMHVKMSIVIHTHPIYSSILGVNHMELPGISEDFVQIVGDKIICSKYALPGTSELAANVLQALGNRNAVILPNHGTLCVGKNLKDALKISYVVEKTAQVYIMAKSIGTPYLISDEDVKAMQDFARNHYGQRE